MTTWAKENTLDGRPVIDEPWVRSQLAEIAMDIEVLKLFNFRVAWQLTQGVEPFAEASMTKIFGSELLQRVTGVCIDMMGLLGGLQPPSKLAPFSGRYQQEFLSMRLLTFGGGANEVLRDIIALIGLGMPPSR
jgi:alkylation response protein AidB-like acyl-CoA dehydrogenase